MTPVGLDHLTAVTVTYRCGDKPRLLLGDDGKAENVDTGVGKGTSCSRAGVERQTARSSPEDLLLGFWPLFLFVALFFSLWQAKLAAEEGRF